MKNLEIASITNAYAQRRESAANAKGEGIRLPAKAAWIRRLNMDRLFKAKEIIDKALEDIQAKYRDDDHSIEEPGGEGKRRIRQEFVGDFIREQAEIMEQDTPVDIQKIPIEDLNGLELTDADLDTLAFMIQE